MSRFISFDIGFRNFAFSIIDMIGKDQWNIIHMANVDLLGEEGEFNDMFWLDFHNFLQTSGDWLSSCSMCLIEKQLGFRGKVNYKAIQMATHLWAHILSYHPHVMVLEYMSSNKTRVFGVSKPVYKERKLWAVEFVHNLLSEQGDFVALEWLKTFPKQDDICDTILMILAYNKEKKKIVK